MRAKFPKISKITQNFKNYPKLSIFNKTKFLKVVVRLGGWFSSTEIPKNSYKTQQICQHTSPPVLSHIIPQYPKCEDFFIFEDKLGKAMT